MALLQPFSNRMERNISYKKKKAKTNKFFIIPFFYFYLFGSFSLFIFKY